MGWMLMVKIYEDEIYINYSYSHDSDILDGTIKVKKSIGHSEEIKNKPMKDLAEIKTSISDSYNFFAMQALGFIMKICLSGISEFPERKHFAWGYVNDFVQ